MERKEYESLKKLFQKECNSLITYTDPEDFIQECFVVYCTIDKNLPLEKQIKECVHQAYNFTRPTRCYGQHMYEIPIGIPEEYIEHPRTVSEEFGEI